MGKKDIIVICNKCSKEMTVSMSWKSKIPFVSKAYCYFCKSCHTIIDIKIKPKRDKKIEKHLSGS